MKALIVIFHLLASVVACYLIGCLVAWDYNTDHWPDAGRVVMVLCSLVLCIIVSAYEEILKQHKENESV